MTHRSATIEHLPRVVPSLDGVICTFGCTTEFERCVNTPSVNTSFVSFAQMLFVCNLKLTSGKDALEGDFIGDAEERLTGLLVGDIDGADNICARENACRLFFSQYCCLAGSGARLAIARTPKIQDADSGTFRGKSCQIKLFIEDNLGIVTRRFWKEKKYKQFGVLLKGARRFSLGTYMTDCISLCSHVIPPCSKSLYMATSEHHPVYISTTSQICADRKKTSSHFTFQQHLLSHELLYRRF